MPRPRADRPRRPAAPKASERNAPPARAHPASTLAWDLDGYRVIFEQASDPILVGFVDGPILAANARACELLGYPSEELVGLEARAIAHAPDLVRQPPPLRALEAGETVTTRRRLVRRDGTLVEVELSTRRIAHGVFMSILHDLGARARAEDEVRRSEDRFRALIEHAHDVIGIVDTSGVVRFVSPAIERMLGITPGALVGTSAIDLVHPEDVQRTTRVLARLVAEGGESEILRFRLRHRDGGYRWVEGSGANRLGDPAIAGLTVNLRDVSAVRSAVGEQRRLHAILEATPDFVGTADPDGRVRYVNAAGLRIMGIGADEDVTAMRIGDFHPEDETRIQLGIALPTAERDGVWQGETRLRTRDGVEIPVSQVIIAHRGEAGELLYFSTIMRDMRERQDAIRALAESESHFRALIENASDLVAIVNRDATIRYAAPSLERVLGHAGVDLVGRRLLDLAHPDDGRALAHAFAQSVSRSGPMPLPAVRLRHGDGSWRWFEGTANNLVHDPVVGGVVLNAREVTARLEAEDALRRSEEHVRQMQKLEAIGLLAGGVAHDFNNLLTAIEGHTELMLDRVREDDPLREGIEQIREAAERATQLTRQLLAFSRKQRLEPHVLDVREVVERVEKMLRRMIGEDVRMRTLLDPHTGRVKADPGQLEQVIVNLVVNARDAMPAGGRLVLETRNAVMDEAFVTQNPGARRGRYVAITVSDTGVGMDAETQARIFEPFFTTKERGRGTGLGLATVYGIVKQSDGYITVHSEVGLGTTFTVYLPRVEEPAEVVRRVVEDGEIAGGHETVLLVEDDGMVRELASKVLSRYGYEVVVAADGFEALHALRTRPDAVDLIVTDVVMPGMSGRDLADRVHASRPDVPVLFVSGYADEAIVRHGVLDPSVPFIHKPFTPGVFARRVRELLDQAARGR